MLLSRILIYIFIWILNRNAEVHGVLVAFLIPANADGVPHVTLAIPEGHRLVEHLSSAWEHCSTLRGHAEAVAVAVQQVAFR